jgi:glycosyltransferase involved in cell wall biosynthesis
MARRRFKLLYLVTEDWFFWSHRLPMARAARDAGFDVVVACRVRDHGERIRGEGFRLAPLSLRRGSRNPFFDLAALIEIIALYRREKPDIVHHVAMKPVIYGSLAAAISGIHAVVNALTGLGYLFLSNEIVTRILRLPLRWMFRLLLNRKGSRLLLQNDDDAKLLVAQGVVDSPHIVIIRGSGVDCRRFAPGPETPGIPIAVLASRMLWDKGVGELVAAARILRDRGTPVRVLLVGDPDSENPATIPIDQLDAWNREGVVEWRRRTDDVPAILRASHIAVLPSYREGLPKSLLEAAAAGLPIVASDVPGCREIAHDGENAILVPVKDATALADAIERLARNPDLRRRLGSRGRELALASFTEESVAAKIVALYRAMLDLPAGSPAPPSGAKA